MPDFPRLVSPPTRDRPVLAYDDDCTFCKRWVARWEQWTGDAIAYEPYQKLTTEFPEIPTEAFAEAVKLIEPSGRVTSGAAAVFRSLALGGATTLGWILYRRVPAFAPLCEFAYHFIARHRLLFSRLTTLLLGPDFPRRRPLHTRPWLWLLAASALILLWHRRRNIS